MIGPSQIFLKHWALPNKIIYLCPLRFYSLYTWKFNFTKNIWDKSVMLLKTHRKIYENLLGTRWECIENIYIYFKIPFTKTQKKNKNHPPKCMLSLLIGCMKILFLNWFVTIISLGKWQERGVWVYYSLILLIIWGAFQVQLFLQQANLIGPSLKKLETMDVPQTKRLYFEI